MRPQLSSHPHREMLISEHEYFGGRALASFSGETNLLQNETI